jgi:hypothetical protein
MRASLFLTLLVVSITTLSAQALHSAKSTPFSQSDWSADALYAKKKTKTKTTTTSSSTTSSNASYTSSKNPVRFNVGAGPAWYTIGGPIGEEQWHYGLALDIYLVYPPAQMRENQRNLDPRFKRWNLFQPDEEFVDRPYYLVLLPTKFFFSPMIHDMSIYGLTFNGVDMWVSKTPIPEITFKAGLGFPTVTLFKAEGDLLDAPDWFMGMGATLKTKILLRVSERVLLSGGWSSAFYLPGEDTEFHYADGHDENTIHIGTFDAQFHYRFNFMR